MTDQNGNLLGGGENYCLLFDVLVGDYDDSGYVSVSDMLGIRDAFTSSYVGVNFADVNGDGRVDNDDFLITVHHLRNELP